MIYVFPKFFDLSVDISARAKTFSRVFLYPAFHTLSDLHLHRQGLTGVGNGSPSRVLACRIPWTEGPSILACRIPWTEGPGGLQSTGWLRVGRDWATEHTQQQWLTPVCLLRTRQGAPGRSDCLLALSSCPLRDAQPMALFLSGEITLLC